MRRPNSISEFVNFISMAKNKHCSMHACCATRTIHSMAWMDGVGVGDSGNVCLVAHLLHACVPCICVRIHELAVGCSAWRISSEAFPFPSLPFLRRWWRCWSRCRFWLKTLIKRNHWRRTATWQGASAWGRKRERERHYFIHRHKWICRALLPPTHIYDRDSLSISLSL